MAKEIMKDAVVKLTAPGAAKVDLSDHFSECTIEQVADEVDVTGFTAAGYREFIVGMKDATIGIFNVVVEKLGYMLEHPRIRRYEPTRP